jgi:hypothetical protein
MQSQAGFLILIKQEAHNNPQEKSNILVIFYLVTALN